MQAACLIIVLYVAFSYMSHKRVQTGFRKTYMAMLTTAVVFILFDALVYFLAFNHDLLPMQLVDLFHRLYFMCMDLMVFITFIYVMQLVHGKKIFSVWQRVLFDIPFLISVTAALFMPIQYNKSSGTAVAFGGAVVALDLNTIAYVLISAVIIFRHKSSSAAKKLNALMQAFGFLIVTAVLEMFYPFADLYPICVMLLILLVYMALGDPKEYEDEVSGGFNRAAFVEVLSERFGSGRPFAVLNVVITNWTEIMDATDGVVEKGLFDFAGKAAALLSTQLYRSAYNSVSYIIPIEKSSDFKAEEAARLIENDIVINGMELKLKTVKSLLICPSEVSESEQVLENINELSVNAYRDKMFIDNVTGCLNRNAYEQDMIRMNAGRSEFSSVACIMVDVNGLKATNDTWGHECGDELIIATAKLLNESFGNISRIYRIGGDEFLCVFNDVEKDIICERQAELENARAQTVLSFGMTVSFASGAAFLGDYDANLQEMVKRADRMMYRDKMRSGKMRK